MDDVIGRLAEADPERGFADSVETPEGLLAAIVGGSEIVRRNSSDPGCAVRRRVPRSLVVSGLVALVVFVVLAPIDLFSESDSASPSDANPSSTVSAEPSLPVAVESAVPSFGEYGSVRQVPSTGELVGLKNQEVWLSNDDGETWTVLAAADHDFELLEIASDGSVLVIRNPSGIDRGALGLDSVSNPTPELHRFDPTTREWQIVVLPRPELPVEDLSPAPEDAATCPLFGLQSFVDAAAISVGLEIVILGNHRVVGDGVCDELFQHIWVSEDGFDWEMFDIRNLDGWIDGLFRIDERYVGYGNTVPAYIADPRGMLRMWTMETLPEWVELELDLSALPDGAVLHSLADGGSPSIVGPDGIAMVFFDVELPILGLADLNSIEALNEWLFAAKGLGETTVEELDALLAADFPLDQEEIDNLRSFYWLFERHGWATLRSSDGLIWQATYTAGLSTQGQTLCPDSAIVNAKTGDPVTDCQNEYRARTGETPPPMAAFDNGSGGVAVLIDDTNVPSYYTPLPPGQIQDPALIELSARLSDVGRGLTSRCYTVESATPIVQGTLDNLSLVDWTITVGTRQPDGDTLCAYFSLDHAQRVVVLIGVDAGDLPGGVDPFASFAAALHRQLEQECLSLEAAIAVVEALVEQTEVIVDGVRIKLSDPGVVLVIQIDDGDQSCAHSTVNVGGRVEITVRGLGE